MSPVAHTFLDYVQQEARDSLMPALRKLGFSE